ncbi:MAG TPA: 50S ribosomal protein L18, partial [Planctomycetota bacterium]|nr:50S ribosomal protein L18 [Planctomycetota bacterium]
MNREKRKQVQRKKRHYRVRHRVHGTAERPRLTVFRSLKNIYAQIINDDEGRTLVSA